MQEVAIMFSNMDKILKLIGRFFLKLNARIGQWDSNSCIGDLFSVWLKDQDVSKEYAFYISRLEDGIILYNRKYSEDEKFRTHMEDCVDEKTNWLFLPSFLQLPIHRISQYKDWLSKIRKLTLPSHTDYALLDEAITASTNLQSQLHEVELKSRREKRCIAIHNAFKLQHPPDRVFLREGTVQYLEPSGSSFVVLYLFSDVLLWAIPNLDSLPISTSIPTLQNTYSLRDLNIVELQDSNTVQNVFRFEIGSTGGESKTTRKLDVCTGRKSDRQEWIDIMKQAQEKLRAQK